MEAAAASAQASWALGPGAANAANPAAARTPTASQPARNEKRRERISCDSARGPGGPNRKAYPGVGSRATRGSADRRLPDPLHDLLPGRLGGVEQRVVAGVDPLDGDTFTTLDPFRMRRWDHRVGGPVEHEGGDTPGVRKCRRTRFQQRCCLRGELAAIAHGEVEVGDRGEGEHAGDGCARAGCGPHRQISTRRVPDDHDRPIDEATRLIEGGDDVVTRAGPASSLTETPVPDVPAADAAPVEVDGERVQTVTAVLTPPDAAVHQDDQSFAGAKLPDVHRVRPITELLVGSGPAIDQEPDRVPIAASPAPGDGGDACVLDHRDAAPGLSRLRVGYVDLDRRAWRGANGVAQGA